MSTTVSVQPGKGLHVGVWIVQILLALAFGMAGLWKLTTAPEALVQQGLAWAVAVPPVLVKFIGLSEFLGAVGLVLPAATRIKPQLTAWAASGLVTVMVLASGFHLMRGEAMAAPVNLVMGLLAAFVAWGRFKKAPIVPRH